MTSSPGHTNVIKLVTNLKRTKTIRIESFLICFVNWSHIKKILMTPKRLGFILWLLTFPAKENQPTLCFEWWHSIFRNCGPNQFWFSHSYVFLNWPTPASFSFILGLFKQTLQIFTTDLCEKISIQFTVLGFEPTTLWTWVSSHNPLPGLPPK